jgi:hypothetical protein
LRKKANSLSQNWSQPVEKAPVEQMSVTALSFSEAEVKSKTRIIYRNDILKLRKIEHE